MNNQLNEINEKFKLIFENVEDLFFLYNLKPNPKFEYVSPSSLNISGYTPEEYYNNPDIFNKLVHTDDMALFEFIKENFKIIKKPIIIRWICKDGKIIWTEQKFVSILDKKGDLKAIQGVIRDITKKKETEFALRESEKKFRELFHQINDPIFLFKFSNDIPFLKLIEVNSSACNLFLFSRDELFKMKSIRRVVDNSQLQYFNYVMKEILGKKQVFLETIFQNKKREKIPVEINAHMFILNGENVILAIVRDISEKKKLEKESLKRQKLESISILAGGIAHEFNNILSAILGNISLAKFLFNNNKKENIGELLYDSEKAIQKAKLLINKLITFSKGGAPIRENIFLNELIKNISEGMSQEIKIKTFFSDDLYPVYVDKEQITQVINNIIVNALEYTDEKKKNN